MVEEFGRYYTLMCENYDTIKGRFVSSYRRTTGDRFDDDVFHDTLLKCAETLTETEMENMTDEALINYTYTAFRNNMFRDKRYARNRCRVDAELDEFRCDSDNSEYWNMRCAIRDFIIEHFDEDTFEECCQWVIDRKSVREIEDEHNDRNLYYKFRKIKAMVVKEFGDDLFDIPEN